ncbi:LysR family transcriptional regulator [Roseomonas nepalensis]|uniref:LysR family transcriptional regulator n=1 Tax=Muricoccus nepalensis TaxID=1854500 RepID=A0A502FT43_9PROT|nr:LysR family transcriptional regulator [Roseomonas nepalensis]TPG52286.1 LysR family transcriptional regulator [Roseomonas nepalensis]
MDTPTLRQLRTFLAAVERGSITEAARSQHLTQPAASQQLRELERILGARLLDRAEGRVMATAAGNAILAPARRAQAAVEELVGAAATFRSGETGRVRLGTGATACIHLLPPVLTAAKARMPGLEILVAIGNTPDVLRRVEEGDLDAGFVTMPRTLSRALTTATRQRDGLAALVPADTPGEGALTPAQLAAMPLILYESGGDTRGVVDAWFRKAKLAPRPIMELGSVEAIKVLVGSGLGASVLPCLALGSSTPGAERRPLRPETSRELGLVLRKEKVRDRGLRVLTEALEAVG